MSGDAAFLRVQRAHGNAIEHVPLVLLLLLLLELSGASQDLLLAIGGAFLAARVGHAVGLLLRTRHLLHVVGSALTYLVELALAVLLLWRAKGLI